MKTLLSFGEDYDVQPGDVVTDLGDAELKPAKGTKLPKLKEATVASVGKKTVVLRPARGAEVEVMKEAYWSVDESPAIRKALEERGIGAIPDGVAFSDTTVPAALRTRLRRNINRLAAAEPVDHHPGSGTRVRDLVHPSLYPYVAKKSKTTGELPRPPEPKFDRFGRTFESSRYQWLPTPFRIARDGTTTIDGYINNLDTEAYAPLHDDLAELFTSVLPLVESVLGYVNATKFWQNDDSREPDNGEADLPEPRKARAKPVKPRSVRGRELQVIPKIVDYHLDAGEVHEGVWHVEGMSHEHIVATCVYVLDRDRSLAGGDLSFKRSYTREEAGQLFWNASQIRPRVIDRVVEEGTIPLGSVATPAGRVVVFPNSHIHRLNALTVGPRSTSGTRRVIVFWIVDPDVRIVSTREVPPQQSTMKREEALRIRLKLMAERKRHKSSFNVRAVSLCEH